MQYHICLVCRTIHSNSAHDGASAGSALGVGLLHWFMHASCALHAAVLMQTPLSVLVKVVKRKSPDATPVTDVSSNNWRYTGVTTGGAVAMPVSRAVTLRATLGSWSQALVL